MLLACLFLPYDWLHDASRMARHFRCTHRICNRHVQNRYPDTLWGLAVTQTFHCHSAAILSSRNCMPAVLSLSLSLFAFLPLMPLFPADARIAIVWSYSLRGGSDRVTQNEGEREGGNRRQATRNPIPGLWGRISCSNKDRKSEKEISLRV